MTARISPLLPHVGEGWGEDARNPHAFEALTLALSRKREREHIVREAQP